MSFPNLPTDSFYKFMVFLGLVCLFLSYKVADKSVGLIMEENKLIKGNILNFEKEIKDLEIENKYILYNDKLSKIEIDILIEKNSNTIDYNINLIDLNKKNLEDFFYFFKVKLVLILILFILGALLSVFGSIYWYESQLLVNKKNLKEYIELGKISGFCGSCTIKIGKNSKRPLNKDGTINYSYCTDCFSKGEFKDPDLTLEEMKERIRKSKRNYLMKKISVALLEGFERWKVS